VSGARRPQLTVVFGQQDQYSTSFQTRQLSAALAPWLDVRPRRVPDARSRLGRAAARVLSNYVGPCLTRPSSQLLLYGNDGAVDLSHWRGTRIVYWYDAPWDWGANPPQRAQWVQHLRYRNVIEAEHVFAVSRTQVDVARALRPGRETGVAYLPVGVDCRTFDPARAAPGRVRARFGLPACTIVGYLGYLGFWKGRFAGEVLLEAAPRVAREHDVHFLVVGFGPALGQWKERVRALGLEGRFTFTGWVEDALVPDCLAAMDVCVDTLEPGFHSEARSETKLKQYMAMARACVATAIGENRTDLEGGRCGALVGPGPGPLADAISALCGDGERRRELGERARARALEVYDWPVLARTLVRTVGVADDRSG
jgi:glycosyltransferase involved in cell wall biosynthesis